MPFWRSRPSRWLVAAAVAAVVVAVLLPLSPLAGTLGFVPPPLFWVVLRGLVAFYLALVETAKWLLLRRATLAGGAAHAIPVEAPLTADEARRLDAYWRAANYLSVGQIYLLDNPLLREPLRPEHVKPRLLGHWGTTPGLNFIYAHLNRVIRHRDLDVIYVTGPGHGGPALVANTYLEGTYSEVYPDVTPGRGRACGGCSASSPFRAASRATSRPRRPARSTRAASSATRSPTPTAPPSTTPTCIVCCVVGDGEAETGPLATSWHSNKFLEPGARRRRAADPAPERLQDRQPDRARPHPERGAASPAARATATSRIFVEATSPAPMHQQHGGGARRRRRRIAAIQRPRARATAITDASALADDRAAHAQGLDRAEGRRRPAGRGHVARAPGAARRRARQPRAPAHARGVDARATGPRSSSTTTGRLVPELAELPPERRRGA